MKRVLHTVLLHPVPRYRIGTSDAETEALHDAVIKEFRTIKRKGGLVKTKPAPRSLGRAVSQTVFVKQFLKGNRSLLLCKKDVMDELDKIVSGDAIPRRWQDLYMSQHDAWVTWDPDGDRPFAFAQRHGIAFICSCLGLRYKDLQSLLLLEYRNDPSLIQLFRATIADAEDYWHYEPTLHGSDHGWTKCGPKTGPIKRPIRPVPRPEAVHERRPFRGLNVAISRL